MVLLQNYGMFLYLDYFCREMIEVKNIHKAYRNVQVLNGVDMQVAEGEIVSITGASGSGKSTLLHITGALEEPDKGEVLLQGENIFSLNEKQLAYLRNRKIGFVFQFHHLFPEFTAFENVCIPGYIGGFPAKDVHKKADELLKFLGLAKRRDHKPSQLSGGEQQRVAIARAVINNPQVLLADEPSGNLDEEATQEIHQLFFRLRDEFNQTVVIATHDSKLADMADRKLILKGGKLYGV